MAGPAPPVIVRRLRRASQVARAIAGFLEDIASLLRQLVHIAGWLVLLISIVNLLFHPYPSLAHLVTPGAGALAILQNLIRHRPRQTDGAMNLLDGLPEVDSGVTPIEAVIVSDAEVPTNQATSL